MIDMMADIFEGGTWTPITHYSCSSSNTFPNPSPTSPPSSLCATEGVSGERGKEREGRRERGRRQGEERGKGRERREAGWGEREGEREEGGRVGREGRTERGGRQGGRG